MADQKKPANEDLRLDVILAEARSLRKGAPPRGDKAAEGPPQARKSGGPEQAEPAVPPVMQVKTADGGFEGSSPLPKREKKKKRGLFGRRKREYPEFNEAEDIYYGLQLKTLAEYRKDYEKTILIDTKKVREGARNSEYSYLFSHSGEDAEALEISRKFEELHEKRRQRVEQALHHAGMEQDDIFSLYEPERKAAGPKEKAPLPQEEPAVPPVRPPVVPPEKPSPVPVPGPSPVPIPQPVPAPTPEILPGPGRQPEIPQPISDPVYQPEPVRPSTPQPAGAPLTMEQRAEAERPEESAAALTVADEVPPPRETAAAAELREPEEPAVAEAAPPVAAQAEQPEESAAALTVTDEVPPPRETAAAAEQYETEEPAVAEAAPPVTAEAEQPEECAAALTVTDEVQPPRETLAAAELREPEEQAVAEAAPPVTAQAEQPEESAAALTAADETPPPRETAAAAEQYETEEQAVAEAAPPVTAEAERPEESAAASTVADETPPPRETAAAAEQYETEEPAVAEAAPPVTAEAERPEEPVREPVSVPDVKEEVPPPPPRREPDSPPPLRVKGFRAYRNASGRPVHTIELDDIHAVFAEAAQEYPTPAPVPPAPVPLPKRRPRASFHPPIVLEHTSEFEAVSPSGPESGAAPEDEEAPPPISFPAPVSPAEEEEESAAEENKKKKKFHIFGNEEEENEDRENLPEEPDELEDYGSPADAPSVTNDLAADVRRLFLRLSVTGICTVLLLVSGLLGEYSGILPAPVRFNLDIQTYLILNLIFLLVAAAFSITPLLDGFRALFRFQANGDTALSVAVAAAVLQSCAAFAAQDSVQSGAIHVYAALACAALLLNTAGKLILARRIYLNFRFVAAPDRKQAVQIFDDHNTALQMAEDCVLDTPVIAYQTRTEFLSRFLHNSYDADPSDRSARMMAPVSFLCSLAVCLVTLILTKDAEQAVTAFAAAACVSIPFTGTLSAGLPMRRLSKIGSRCGAMIVGYPAVEQFSAVNAVMVDAKDLFPRGTVILNGIKTFAGQRIDQAILDATALMCAVGGPLSDLFDQIIKSRHDILPKIEQPVYEDDKGITGWVSGRRILVGSRSLMEAHSIEPPSRDYEAKYIQGGQRVIYLASGGDLVAMFILSYTSDRRRSLELRRMEDNGISLIVRTCDPNITPALLAECFGLEEQSIRVLPERLGSVYVELTVSPREETPALLATKGRPTAMMRMLTACVRQRGNISIAVALQSVSVVLGLLLVGFLTFYSGLRQLGTSSLLFYELFWTAAVLFVPKLRKP